MSFIPYESEILAQTREKAEELYRRICDLGVKFETCWIDDSSDGRIYINLWGFKTYTEEQLDEAISVLLDQNKIDALYKEFTEYVKANPEKFEEDTPWNDSEDWPDDGSDD